jgi:hypothetical protein
LMQEFENPSHSLDTESWWLSCFLGERLGVVHIPTAELGASGVMRHLASSK